MIYGLSGWRVLARFIAANLILNLVYPNDSQHGQCLSKIEPSLSPFEGVCTRQSEEIACDSIVDIEVRVIQISCAPRLCCDTVAFLDEAD